MRTLLYDCRYSLFVAVLAGLGRAMSEVGAVMIVGGNIDRSTRDDDDLGCAQKPAG